MPHGTIEIGGTKTDMGVGETPDDLSRPMRIGTTHPEETIGRLIDYFRGQEVDAIGVACFGPLQLDRSRPGYGSITSTPKPDWSGVGVLEELASSLDVPIAIDTDVNGAALGEGRWGAAVGLDDFVYVTVGTGVGGGAVVHGSPITGASHPEMGHVVITRHPDDDYPGRCPFHGACLEGMAAGPALEERFGSPDEWSDEGAVVDLATYYVAQAMRDIVYILAPQRIIVGGGVSTLAGFHDRLRTHMKGLLNGYPGEPDLGALILAPELGALSGLAGGLVLAERALA